MLEVSKVEVSRKGQKVLQVKHAEEVYWITEDKFKEIFDCFILVCARKSHFWTTRQVDSKPERKIVVKVKSQVAAQGSVTLYYSSKTPSSLCLYKELDSKVLKLMGKIQEKPN